jgi:hypothetical protein
MAIHSGPADWWTEGTDEGRAHIATKGIVQSGLVLNLDAGVAASYPGSGTTWTDLSGNGNNGTLVNGPTYNSTVGGVIQTDGTNDYVNISGTPISNTITTAVTMSCFMNLTSTTLFGSIAGYDNPGSAGQLFSFQVRTSNTNPALIYFVLYTTQSFIGGTTGNAYVSVPYSTWKHVVGTYDGNSVKMYLDGVLTNSDSASGSFAASALNVRLGSDVSRNRWATGSWNNFSIYNRALTAVEIQQNFNALRGRYGI